MSRIGNKVIEIPNGVKASYVDGLVNVEGVRGKLNMTLPEMTAIEISDKEIKLTREDDTRRAKAMHGLARSLVNNMVIGVSEGYKKELEIIGVGYKAQISGQKMTLNIGFSHTVEYQVPEGVKVLVTDNTKVAIEGANKQMVGEVAATIRRFRKPEPYKGKGIRYVGERIVLKEGKTVG